ncbi:MAG: hypothetical protein DCF19_19545 [Pseudanabaena frigida]|uniref:Uncharacterized protein n=1 Tax=Pseudanabaena frigida TaxID=945775 RepID=A0A2W4VXX4_9CYAN|nr:MAG: hypothetical protein DCF19_19545 [Pseudanabaena frigida]
MLRFALSIKSGKIDSSTVLRNLAQTVKNKPCQAFHGLDFAMRNVFC